VEAFKYEHGHPVRLIYVESQETTYMTDILGTLSNNQFINMLPVGEDNSVFNVVSKAPKPDEYGLVCARHTTHSTEALKVRKISDRVMVHMLGEDILWSIMQTATVPHDVTHGMWSEFDSWIFYIMDYIAFATISDVHRLWACYMSQECAVDTRYTLYIYAKHKVVVLLALLGVLLKRLASGHIVDSCMLHKCQYPPGIVQPMLAYKELP